MICKFLSTTLLGCLLLCFCGESLITCMQSVVSGMNMNLLVPQESEPNMTALLQYCSFLITGEIGATS